MLTIQRLELQAFQGKIDGWLPRGSQPLHVSIERMDRRTPILIVWALVDQREMLVQRNFFVAADGYGLPDGEWRHCGSVVDDIGALHVFMREEPTS